MYLVIVDGFGYREDDTNSDRNAITRADADFIDKLYNSSSLLKCSGNSVGLPNNRAGNSEVGHLTIGAGKPIEQPYLKIEKMIDKGELSSKILDKIDGERDFLHLVGLCSDGGVHSDIRHLEKISEIVSEQGMEAVVHFIADGRDVEPNSAIKYLERVDGDISTIAGRHYAMDRDNNYERTKSTVDALFGSPETTRTPKDVVRDSYSQGMDDQYIEPVSVSGVKDINSDSQVLFFNFRDDRMRQLSKHLLERLESEPISMTPYLDSEKIINLVDYEDVEFTVTEFFEDRNVSQYRVTESEKEPHVTWFLDGQKNLELRTVTKRIFTSPDVDTYDKKPEMRALDITDYAIDIENREDGKFFCVVNYPNLDLVGHTGDFDSTVRAVECIDRQLHKLVDNVDSPVLITSDHGNAEQMGSTANPKTSHTKNKTPVTLMNSEFEISGDGELSNLARSLIDLAGEEISGDYSINDSIIRTHSS